MDIIKKNTNFRWGAREKENFYLIKESIMHAPNLMSPDYNKYFILYLFSSDTSYVMVLTQKSSEEEEFPVAFMSSSLHNAELK